MRARPIAAPFVAAVGGAVLAGALAWAVALDLGWGYVPVSDSALYLDAAMHVGRGEGVTTFIGYPVDATAASRIPFTFHPPGSILLYAPAGLFRGADAIAAGLGIALLIHLAAIAVCAAVALRLTASPLAAFLCAAALGLDPSLLSESTGVYTTVPFVLAITVVTALFAGRWPPSRGLLAAAGTLFAAAHFMRVSDLPLVAAVVVVLAASPRTRSRALWFLAPYVAGVLMGSPFVPATHAQGALLIAGIPGYQGFSPSQLDPPTVMDALTRHFGEIARKAVAGIVEDVRAWPAEANGYVLVPGLAAATAGLARGERRAALLALAVILTVAFSGAVAVGSRYFVHVLPALYLAAYAGVRTIPHARVAAAAMSLTAVVVFAGYAHDLARSRDATQALGASYLDAAAAIREATTARDTVISDTPTFTGPYAERRSFAIPLRMSDLPRLEERIGRAALLVLSRHQLENPISYPDPAWRAALDRDRVGDFALFRVVGSGDSEIRIYRRP